MFCSKCGAQLEDSAAFCVQCGSPVEGADASSVQAGTPASPDGQEPAIGGQAAELAPAEPVTVASTPAEPATVASTPAESATVASTPAAPVTPANPPQAADSASQTTVLTDLSEQAVASPVPTVPETAASTCPNCGAPLQDNAKFCIACGHSTAAPAAAPTVPTTMAAVGGMQTASMPPQNFTAPPSGGQSGDDSKKKVIIIAVAAVAIVAIIAVIVGVFVLGGNSGADSKSSGEITQAQEQSIQVSFTGGTYSSGTATPIAIRVDGYRSQDGTSYTQTFYLDGSQSVKLPYGHYDATPKASPLTDDGTLYTFSPTSITFDVSNAGASTALSWTLSPIDAASVTDQQINDAVAAARDADISEADANSLRDKAVAKRDQAKQAAADAAAAEAKAKADAEAAAKAQAEAEAAAKAQANAPTWYVCASDFVTLRTSTSTSASEITRITSRQPVKYLGNAGGGWSQVSYNGQTGYVLTRFISSNPNAPLDYGDV